MNKHKDLAQYVLTNGHITTENRETIQKVGEHTVIRLFFSFYSTFDTMTSFTITTTPTRHSLPEQRSSKTPKFKNYWLLG